MLESNLESWVRIWSPTYIVSNLCLCYILYLEALLRICSLESPQPLQWNRMHRRSFIDLEACSGVSIWIWFGCSTLLDGSSSATKNSYLIKYDGMSHHVLSSDWSLRWRAAGNAGKFSKNISLMRVWWRTFLTCCQTGQEARHGHRRNLNLLILWNAATKSINKAVKSALSKLFWKTWYQAFR